MTSEGLGEMFEGDSADMCAGKFPIVSMGGRAEGLACTDPGARTPIGASGNFLNLPRSNHISLYETLLRGEQAFTPLYGYKDVIVWSTVHKEG